MATQQSHCKRLSPSPPPLAPLADKVYRHPPTPSDYDVFSLRWSVDRQPPPARHSFPKLLLPDAAFNIHSLCFAVVAALLPNPPDERRENILRKVMKYGGTVCIVSVLGREIDWE